MPHCCRFNSINGMLIPGGSADLKPGHPFYDATEYLFKLALEANDKGDYFPVSPSRNVGLEEPVPSCSESQCWGQGPLLVRQLWLLL